MLFLFGFILNGSDREKLFFHLENDVFTWQDREYTHGLEFVYYNEEDTHNGRSGNEFVLGQQLFTPVTQNVDFILPNERPYAAYLYAGYVKHWYNDLKYTGLAIQLGVLGPTALGEDFQNGVHNFIGISERKGWGNQLEDEIAGQLEWENRRRIHSSDFLDIISFVNARAGNVHLDTSAGFQFKIGLNLSEDFGFSDIESVGHPTGDWGSIRKNFSLYLMGGLKGGYVAHNIFLDGNVFADRTHSVAKNHWVGEASFGFGLEWEAWQIRYMHIFRSREYKTQEKIDHFGSLTIGRNF